jgi:osmotically-inducible protein OsmY
MQTPSILAAVLSLAFVSTGCMRSAAPAVTPAGESAALSAGDQQIERDRHERMAIQRAERDRIAQRDGEDPTCVMPEAVPLADGEITRRVLEAVAADATLSDAARNVSVSTSSTVVSLHGDVLSSAERNAIDAHAHRIVGASRVHNMLSVTAEGANEPDAIEAVEAR